MDGGNFKAGIKADYGSETYPGGKNKTGTLSTSELALGFGARVMFDVNGKDVDKIVARKMTIEKKDWENGPEYSAPVFVFTSQPQEGEYLLAEIEELTGDIHAIVVEGRSGKNHDIPYADGTLLLAIQD